MVYNSQNANINNFLGTGNQAGGNQIIPGPVHFLQPPTAGTLHSIETLCASHFNRNVETALEYQQIALEAIGNTQHS